jgi:4'-phosphopantetheinyl transferase
MTDLRICWPPPPTQWLLENGEIHVWAGNLQPTAARTLAFAMTLARDEMARADRFHFDRDRNRFIAGRGLLRAILAHYANGNPSRLKFDYGPNGKPALSESDRSRGVHFNLAHSDDLLLVAVARTWDIGIDVERIHPVADAEGIARRFFTRREYKGLRNLPDAQKLPAFFNLWTRKEAWLKATGDGISDCLGQVEVSFLADEPARLISLPGPTEAAHNWTLRDLTPAPSFVGALAVPANDIRLNCWRWPE